MPAGPPTPTSVTGRPAAVADRASSGRIQGSSAERKQSAARLVVTRVAGRVADLAAAPMRALCPCTRDLEDRGGPGLRRPASRSARCAADRVGGRVPDRACPPPAWLARRVHRSVPRAVKVTNRHGVPLLRALRGFRRSTPRTGCLVSRCPPPAHPPRHPFDGGSTPQLDERDDHRGYLLLRRRAAHDGDVRCRGSRWTHDRRLTSARFRACVTAGARASHAASTGRRSGSSGCPRGRSRRPPGRVPRHSTDGSAPARTA